MNMITCFSTQLELECIDILEFKDKYVLLFASESEEDKFINKINEIKLIARKLVISRLEDLPITESELLLEMPGDTIYTIGRIADRAGEVDIFLNEINFKVITDFLSEAMGHDIVVACSAGVSRSGAITHYLVHHNYVINENYHTEFVPNPLILNELINWKCNDDLDYPVYKGAIYNDTLIVDDTSLKINLIDEGGFTMLSGRGHLDKFKVIVDGDKYEYFNGSGIKVNKSKLK